ncbi:glycosyltransferase family 2 protein [Ramlibacter sp. MAHUQ-53]|uniref:glycosyltransferase family 2 protein n=1 Tax=unclassified Ramlibacter TaxID=2617605 RepID=UPI00362C5318
MKADLPVSLAAPFLALPCVTLSVVSHGHGTDVLQLLADVARHSARIVEQVIVTLNVPEPELSAALESAEWPFEVVLLANTARQGFGANHNAAFERCRTAYFGVLNPDIRFSSDPFMPLLGHLQEPRTGCAYPLQACGEGEAFDPARELPTPASLLRRHLGGAGRGAPQAREWTNGAFMLFRSSVFRRLGGFDTRYFMYCEDVDICLRLQDLGFALDGAPEVVVAHRAAHASRRDLRHLGWHLRSLWRLWTSGTFLHRLAGGRRAAPPPQEGSGPALDGRRGAPSP